MANKKGEKYECEECGLIVLIEDPCDCAACDLICCGEPMKPVKATKPKSKAKGKPKTKK